MIGSVEAPCAVRCPNCPNAVGANKGKYEPENKIWFEANGKIVYQSTSTTPDSCQDTAFKEATGDRADALKERIAQCDEPDVYTASAPGLLGRLGINTYEARDCPAMTVDPTSPTQLTNHFEGA